MSRFRAFALCNETGQPVRVFLIRSDELDGKEPNKLEAAKQTAQVRNKHALRDVDLEVVSLEELPKRVRLLIPVKRGHRV